MENGAPYHYAFYDFAFNEEIEITYLETYQNTVTWEGDIEEDNVIIIAALFNSEPYRNYADPPLGRPFDAYYVDAAAGVLPGETESNVKNEEFTHTVFCEVGTATWCPSCPGMADALDNIITHENYPFYFVEMVTDVNPVADARMTEYQLRYLPTAFYEGGYEVVIGGGYEASYHKNVIEDLGKREVHDLDFTLSSEWITDGTIDITLNSTNNEALPNTKPDLPTIQGPQQGENGEQLTYELSATDPDDDDVNFKIDWGDGMVSEWIGPYASGELVTVDHTWDEKGTYIIKVKCKDTDGAETDWVWLQVTLPKYKGFFSFFYEWLFEQFPFLENLIG